MVGWLAQPEDRNLEGKQALPQRREATRERLGSSRSRRKGKRVEVRGLSSQSSASYCSLEALTDEVNRPGVAGSGLNERLANKSGRCSRTSPERNSRGTSRSGSVVGRWWEVPRKTGAAVVRNARGLAWSWVTSLTLVSRVGGFGVPTGYPV